MCKRRTASRPDDDGDPENNQGRRLKPGDPDYVGYKHPPRAHRYAPGQCGNDKGRPKGRMNLKTRIAAAMSEPIKLANGQVILPEKLLMQTVLSAISKGDLEGVRTFVFLYKTFGEEPRKEIEDDLDGTRRRILDDAVARRIADGILNTLDDQQKDSDSDQPEEDAEGDPDEEGADD